MGNSISRSVEFSDQSNKCLPGRATNASNQFVSCRTSGERSISSLGRGRLFVAESALPVSLDRWRRNVHAFVVALCAQKHSAKPSTIQPPRQTWAASFIAEKDRIDNLLFTIASYAP